MPAKPKRKLGTLEDIQREVQKDTAVKARKRKGGKGVRKRAEAAGGTTRAAKEIREGTRRKPPPVPDAPLEVIKEMDPDDPAFKHPQGRKRKYENKPADAMSWHEMVRAQEQKRANEKRARVRKREAEIVRASEEKRTELRKRGASNSVVRSNGHSDHVTTDDVLIQEGIIDLDDWDDEELARGYRRNRDGKFGPAPKYIPLEVQQECFRRIVKRGKSKLEGAYIEAINGLVYLSQKAESEKVKLEAVKEIMDRLVGKVPDHLKVNSEAPYEAFLADSLEPIEVTQTTTERLTQTEWELDLGDGEQDSLEAGRPELESETSSPSDFDDAEVVELPKKKAR